MTAEFSVLIPGIPERADKAAALFKRVSKQAQGLPVEVLMFSDNRKLPLSQKRNAMLAASTGRFIAHLDDDDDVSDSYVASILDAIKDHPDVHVICFDQIADLGDHSPYKVTTSLKNENQSSYLKPDGKRGDITRKPWHWCAWNGAIARATPFTSSQYGEDWVWLQEMIKQSTTEFHIDKVLHFYFWTKATTAFE